MYITAYDHIQTQANFVNSTRRHPNYRRLLLNRSVSQRRDTNGLKEMVKPRNLGTHSRTQDLVTLSLNTQYLIKTKEKTLCQNYLDSFRDVNKTIQRPWSSARCQQLLEPKKSLVVKKEGNVRTEIKVGFYTIDIQKTNKVNKSGQTKDLCKKGNKVCLKKQKVPKILSQKKNNQQNLQILRQFDQNKQKPFNTIKFRKNKQMEWLNSENIDPWQTASQFDEEFLY